MAEKILIIEDEEISAMALEHLLISFGYEVTDCVNNTADALNSISNHKPDLIISDIMIKDGISGCEFALQMNKKSNIPFIFVTAHFDDEFLNYALDSNVYGYLLKPYNVHELEAMIKITLHKINKTNSNNLSILEFDNFLYNLETKEFIQNNKSVSIGRKSRILFELLLQNKNNNVSYETLIHVIYNSSDDKYIDNLRHLVKRLKEKLNTQAIISLKNIGYQLQTG